eukprot:SAG22_NODE_1144_length_5376_cov_4.815994_2_plen_107_part_00
MLRFELGRQGGVGDWFVKAYFESLSMAQQRAGGRTLDPRGGGGAAGGGGRRPDRVFVAIRGCSEGPESSCPQAHFTELVLDQVLPSCAETVSAWLGRRLRGDGDGV